MHYIAHADMAFDSVEHIMRDVNYGWLIRYICKWFQIIFLAVYIHIFRSLFYGSYKAPRNYLNYRYYNLSVNDGSHLWVMYYLGDK